MVVLMGCATGRVKRKDVFVRLENASMNEMDEFTNLCSYQLFRPGSLSHM